MGRCSLKGRLTAAIFVMMCVYLADNRLRGDNLAEKRRDAVYLARTGGKNRLQ
jgi:hypothetical protein